MGATAGFVTLGLIEHKEAKKREKRVEEANQRASRVEAAERNYQARLSRRQQVREARIKQAQIQNVAATAGQTSSSAATAAQGSLQTQLGVNTGSINTALAYGEAKSAAELDIMKANKKSDLERAAGMAFDIGSMFV